MTYRERRLAKADRLRGWAQARDNKAQAAQASARNISDRIPFGQPILAGHHSERRHRADLGTIDRAMRTSIESSAMANRMREKAQNIERAAQRAIYSDDADAVERLRMRIAEGEAKRVMIKKYNASCRKGAPDTTVLDKCLVDELASIQKSCSYMLGKGGSLPSFMLTNLGGNLARLRKRLAVLERRALS